VGILHRGEKQNETGTEEQEEIWMIRFKTRVEILYHHNYGM
jgi:hypothetical protein